MDSPVLIAGAAGALLLLVCVLLLVLRRRAASRGQLATALAEAQDETAELRRRLDALTEKLEQQSSSMIRVDDPAYVITDAGEPRPEPNVSDALVLSATVGEPLVKVVAFGHGVRRALSAESRNKIWFEMRREVRASRRRRRKAMKAHIREARAAERKAEPVTERTDAA